MPGKRSKKQRAAKRSRAMAQNDASSIDKSATETPVEEGFDCSVAEKNAAQLTGSETEQADAQLSVHELANGTTNEASAFEEPAEDVCTEGSALMIHDESRLPFSLAQAISAGGILHRATVNLPDLPEEPAARREAIEQFSVHAERFANLIKFIDAAATKKQELKRREKLKQVDKIQDAQKRELEKLYATKWTEGFKRFLINTLLLGIVVQNTSACLIGTGCGLVVLTNLMTIGTLMHSTCTAEVTVIAKRGLAFNDGVDISGFRDSAMVNWAYNWYSDTWQTTNQLEYGPMLWGIKMDLASIFTPNAWKWVDNGDQLSGVKTTHVLSFNEPDHPAQANMDVGTAIAWHQYYFEQFIGRALIGSPAVTNGGYEWLSTFLYNCDLHNACHVDFVAVHWYNKATYIEDFKNWVERVCELAHPRKVWVTEFQGLGIEEEMISFLREVLPWLDAKECVERYAYFGITTNDHHMLVGAGPELSVIGEIYAGFRN